MKTGEDEMQTHALFLKTQFLPALSPAKAFHQPFPIPTVSYWLPGIGEMELNAVLENCTLILLRDIIFLWKT